MRNHTARLAAGAALLALGLAAAAPSRAANSAHFKQTAPADLAVIPQGASNVTLAFQIDWVGLKAQYGAGAKVGLSVFFRCCYSGIPLGDWVAEGVTSKTYTVAAIQQAMTQHNVPKDAPISWTLDLHFVPQQSERAESRFLLNPPHRPGPRYTPSLTPDSPTTWPAKFVVTNDGDGASEPSSLTVSVTPLDAHTPLAPAACRVAPSGFTKDVPVLAPGAKFEVSALALRLGEPDGIGGTHPLTKVPPKASCRFQIRAETGPAARNAGALRPVGVYGALTRTITLSVPAK
ncbi:MAG: hypothetical protein NEA02_16375 [Thermoanaerobaculia bacterium]|nr:hypothetical protein [Thermoanaerobaculia bacterium]